MRKRVVITGLGCISPLGLNVQETWSALLAGKSGAAPITHFDASQHRTKFAAEVKGFDPVALFGQREARKMDRFAQFAIAAANEAMQDAGLTVNETNRALAEKLQEQVEHAGMGLLDLIEEDHPPGLGHHRAR